MCPRKTFHAKPPCPCVKFPLDASNHAPDQRSRPNGRESIDVGVRGLPLQAFCQSPGWFNAGTESTHFLKERPQRVRPREVLVECRAIFPLRNGGYSRHEAQSQQKGRHILRQPRAIRAIRDIGPAHASAPQRNGPIRGPQMSKEKTHLPMAQAKERIPGRVFMGPLAKNPQLFEPSASPAGCQRLPLPLIKSWCHCPRPGTRFTVAPNCSWAA